MEVQREQNPSFSKLLDVLEGGKLESGHLKNTAEELNQTCSKLLSVKQCYLEQQLLASELEGVLQSHTQHPGAQCLAASRLQHCLTICPEQTILGVTTDHLRAVDPIREIKKYKADISTGLEERLKSKCSQVLSWQSPQRGVDENDALRLAKVGQLPGVIRQSIDEQKRNKEQIKNTRQEIVDTLSAKHKVMSEMCSELRRVLEVHKLGVVVQADQVALKYTSTQCTAMIGKLEVMYYQLLKGICSEGRLQALKEIKVHLEAARAKLDKRLIQSQQLVGHYQALGETFISLATQYHEILADIENKQWALTELSKTTS